MKDKINALAMKDTIKNSKIALPIIMLFEVYMLISWLSSVKPENSIRYYGYPILYVVLLLVSGVVLLLIHRWGKELEKNYKKVLHTQNFYSIFFVMWALGVTYIGACYRNSFSELLYVTIITLVPVFCYIGSNLWIVVQLLSAGFMMVLAYINLERFASFETNFCVFTIISIIAGRSLYLIRKNSYFRQIELEVTFEANRKLAFFDILTELPNRRSYAEKIDDIKDEESHEKIYFAMFDLNGLKATNDKLGHNNGDLLIMGAAQALVPAFEGLGNIYRIGGDEFAGIFTMEKDDINTALGKLSEFEKEWSGKNKIKLSIAYGIASVAEADNSVDEAMTLADNRMYENKKNHYEEIKNV